MCSSSRDPISTERPSALLFSSKNRLSSETFSDREDFYVEVARLTPQERVQRWVVEVASWVLHEQISEATCKHIVGVTVP